MKTLLAVLALLLSGCSPEVRCWYATSYSQQIGKPWMALHGRTQMMVADVPGPLFEKQDDLESYVSAHRLKMCGAAQ